MGDTPRSAPSGRTNRPWLAGLIALLVGFGGGYIASDLRGGEELVPDAVYFEPANSTFPIPGAAFTAPFYDADTGQCDKDEFVRMLESDPDRKRAWMEVKGLGSDEEFDEYVGRLVTAILAAPTRFTNHGFRNGSAFSIQSVLDAGTPVLVDPTVFPGDVPIDLSTPGPRNPFLSPQPTFSIIPTTPLTSPFPDESPQATPRVEDSGVCCKCMCGNPLLDPEEPRPAPSPSPTPTRTPRRTPRVTPTPEETPAETTPPPTPSPTPILRTTPPRSPSPTPPVIE